MDGSDNKRDENIHFFSDSDGINKKTGLRIILEYRPNYIKLTIQQSLSLFLPVLPEGERGIGNLILSYLEILFM